LAIDATECLEAPRVRACAPPGSVAHRPADLEIIEINDLEGIAALAPEYEYLYGVTRNTLPFATQEWHLAWCQHLLTRGGSTTQRPMFCVLRTAAGTCAAIVPLILTCRQLGPLKVAALGLVGADPALTEIRNPLIAPGFERAVVGALQARLAGTADWDWIQWASVSPELAEALALEGAPQWYQRLDAYVLDLPRSWAEFRTSLGRNVRESLRHCYNSLRRDGHSFEFVVARAAHEVRPALDRFLELHTMRAHMPWGPRHADRFTGQSLRAFLYDVCERLAARDALRVFQLRISGQVVAARIGFVVGDGLYLYYSGFDPAWARYSVMTTTVAEALRHAIETGVKSVNLSLTGEQSKLRWHPRRITFHSALVRRGSVRSRLACGVYRAAISGWSRPRRLLRGLLRARSWD
jgi:CelD/BcsL family acetyltransferase involved in cellulose biosynthesis